MRTYVISLTVACGLMIAASTAHADPDDMACGAIMDAQLQAVAEEYGGSLPPDIQEMYEQFTADIPDSADDNDEAVCEASRNMTGYLESRR